jgi:hypothetical protein
VDANNFCLAHILNSLPAGFDSRIDAREAKKNPTSTFLLRVGFASLPKG